MLGDLRDILTFLGPGWLGFRLLYRLKTGLGYFERLCPLGTWRARDYSRVFHRLKSGGGPRFFFGPGDRPAFSPILDRWEGRVVGHARKIAEGHIRFFSRRWVEVGEKPLWHKNHVSGEFAPRHTHWSRISDFGYGDIKVIWEPSRFSFVFDLVRAYWRNGDVSFPRRFWNLVESWREANPPNAGVNWKCGQEAALRALAWCFGLFAFLDSGCVSDSKFNLLLEMIEFTGHRIEANIGYALSQKNNHGISECAGLYTIGLLFPELGRAGEWLDAGRSGLERLARELFFDDGSFSQGSANYQRLALHLYCWCLALGARNGQPFPGRIRERLARSVDFIEALAGPDGDVPMFGANDGALLLPLSECDYTDFRPVIQLASVLFRGWPALAPGPWDEDLLWIAGPKECGSARSEGRADGQPGRSVGQRALRAFTGGYFTLGSGGDQMFLRAPRSIHRPGQADALHVSLRWKGLPLLVDAGTYSYNAKPPFDGALAATAVHNTVTVDGHSQMRRAGRFLWLPWLDCDVDARAVDGKTGTASVRASHNGYVISGRATEHRRTLFRLDTRRWLVVDSLSSDEDREYRLHWLLPDLPHGYEATSTGSRLELDTCRGPVLLRTERVAGPCSSSLVRADPESERGWRSMYYSVLEPALSLAALCRGEAALFCSYVGGPDDELVFSGMVLRIRALEKEWRVEFQENGRDFPVISISGGSVRR